MSPTSSAKSKPRVCLACQECRRRKVKCTGGPVCNECKRFNYDCIFREHYREKKNFSIKILKSPDFIKKSSNNSSRERYSFSQPRPAQEPQQQQQQQQHQHHPIVQQHPQPQPRPQPQQIPYAHVPPIPQPQHPFQPHPVSTVSPVPIRNDSISPSSTTSPSTTAASTASTTICAPPINVKTEEQSLSPSSSSSAYATTASLASTSIPLQPNGLLEPEPPSDDKFESLGPAPFLRKYNTFIESMHKMCLKRPLYDIDPSAEQMLNQLVQLPPPLTKEHKVPVGTLKNRQLTEEQMLQCVADFFNSYHVMMPLLDPATWIRIAKSTWRNMDSKPTTSLTLDERNEIALVYMVIALGCSGSFNMTFQEVPDHEWAKEYSERADQLVPNILQQPSVVLCQYIMLRCTFEVSHGKADIGYLYSGIVVKYAFALGCHRVDPRRKTKEAFDKHRLWVSIYIYDKYWSFCVGRPNSVGTELPMPEPYEGAFVNSTRYSMGADHIRARIKFVLMAADLHTEWTSPNTKRDVISLFELANKYASKNEQIARECRDGWLNCDDLGRLAEFTDMQCKEWYWLRMFYWYNRLLLYRPFLMVSAYFDVPHCQEPGDMDPEIFEVLKVGSRHCLEAALTIPQVVLAIDSRVERCQINWFTSLYLETSGVVLLLYAVCQPEPQEDAVKCVDAFNKLFNYMNEGLGAMSRPVLSRDRMQLLQMLTQNRSIRQTLAQTRCNFAKTFCGSRMPQDWDGQLVFEPKRPKTVDAEVTGGYQPDGKLDMQRFESMWSMTLDLVGFES